MAELPFPAPSVLHLIATDERRGAESFAVTLSEELAARGWASGVRAVRASGRPGGHRVVALGTSWHDPRGLLAFAALARRHDVVVAHGSTTLWTAALGLPFRGTPFVYVNIGDPLFWSSTVARRLRVRSLLSRAARVAAISLRAADALHSHLGVPTARLSVIPNARSTDRFQPASPEHRAACRTALGLPPERAVVALIGALSEEKAPGLAIDAVALLADVHLVIAGDGPLRSELERRAEQRAPGRVCFLGTVRQPEQVLAAADVAVLTSRSEGVPGVLIEAGLTGLPCVTTDVGYTADVVRDGVTGRVVAAATPEDVAAGLVDALAHRAVWGAAAREHCEVTYGLTAVVDAWEGLLTEVAAGRQGRRATSR